LVGPIILEVGGQRVEDGKGPPSSALRPPIRT
jgi:hypothetical protein